MSYSIIVAKYKENVEWLSKYIDIYPIYLYDKSGEKYNYNKSINVEYLKNIGRESHTYLYHIVNNYDNLTDYVIFTQGTHIDHIKNFDSLIKPKNCYFYPYFIFPKKFRISKYKGNLESNHENLNIGEWFDKYINFDDSVDKNHYKIKFGAIFTITKENILSRPKEFYMDLLKQLENYGSSPEIGHYFERSWYYIFNCHKTKQSTVHKFFV
jgi:hypothetical protein